MDTEMTYPDQSEIERAKSVLRLKARAARRAVGPEQRHAYAYALAERVLTLPELEHASAVALYGAASEEADPGVLELALRDLGIRIAYPRVADHRVLTLHWVDTPAAVVPGTFGLREAAESAPVADLADISVVIVPGVAFDPHGNRLGFGGGYYDNLFATTEWMPPTVGFAYDEQIVDSVPVSPFDRRVDVIVTPTRTLRPVTTTP